MAQIQGDLIDEFRANGLDIVALQRSDLNAAYEDENLQKVEDQRKFEQRSMGMANIGNSRRGLYGEAVARDLAEQQHKASKQAADDYLLLDLINNGGLGAYIGRQVFGGMSDAEITAAVDRVETETGMSFEEYAASVLGDDVPERRDGEANVDYQRRVLEAVAAEIIDPTTGRIKPRYEDDPVARVIRGDKAYQQIIRQADDLIERLENGAKPEELKPNVQQIAKPDYFSARTAGRLLHANGELSETARHEQDGHSDASMVGDVNRLDNEDGFGAFAFDAKPTAAEVAANEAANAFSIASAPPEKSETQETEPVPKNDTSPGNSRG